MKIPRLLLTYVGLIIFDLGLLVFIADRLLSSQQVDITGKMITAVATLSVGLFGCFIARQQAMTAANQHFIASEKLRLDLFDKRSKVADEVSAFYAELYQHGEVTPTAVSNLSEARFRSRMFFREDAEILLDELWSKAFDHRRVRRRLRMPQQIISPEEREALAAKEEDLMNWFTKIQQPRIQEMFESYMRFGIAASQGATGA